MVYFQTKNLNFGTFLRALDLKMLIYFMAICNILQTFGIFMTIWYIFWYHVPRKIWQPCLIAWLKDCDVNLIADANVRRREREHLDLGEMVHPVDALLGLEPILRNCFGQI
jgi:hypothetical protein